MNPAGTVSTPQFPDLLARAVTEPGVIVGDNDGRYYSFQEMGR